MASSNAVDQKIGLDQQLKNLIVDGGKSMVPADNETYSFHTTKGSKPILVNISRATGGPFGLPQSGRRGAKFSFGYVNADIVQQGGQFKRKLLPCRQTFHAPEHLGIGKTFIECSIRRVSPALQLDSWRGSYQGLFFYPFFFTFK